MELQNACHQSDCNDRIEQGDVKFHLRKRYQVTTLIFFAFMLLYFLRSNLEICGHLCDGPESEVYYYVGLILFWLGFMTAPLGAVGVRKFGGVVTFGAAVGLTGLLSCFTPILDWHVSVLIVARTVEGFLQGVCTSTFIEVIRLWSIPTERSRSIGWAFSGFLLGAVLKHVLVLYTIKIRANSKDWNAALVFCVPGALSLLWCIMWFYFVKNSPEEDHMITTQEKNFIRQKNLDIRNETKVKYTWCRPLKSKPVWAYLIELFVVHFTGYYLKEFMPILFDRYTFRLKSSTIIECFTPIGLIVGSILADYLRKTNKLSVSGVHKLFLSLGQSVPIILTIIAMLFVYIQANDAFTMIQFVIICLMFGITLAAFTVLTVDMGGQYASLISGFGCTVVGFIEILFLVLFYRLLYFKSVVEFIVTMLMLIVSNFCGAIIFYKFGAGDLQPWAVPPEST